MKCHGVGGRTYRVSPNGSPFVDQNLDSYSVEYTFEDGTKLYMDGRCIGWPGQRSENAEPICPCMR